MRNNLDISLILVGLNVLASWYAWKNPALLHRWMFNPYQIVRRKEYWRFLTSGFIHANWGHLLFNMLALWSFGSVLEYYLESIFPGQSTVYFLVLYFTALVVSDLPAFFKHRNNPGYNALGASGAASAVVFATVMFDPWSKVLLLFIPMPGILMALLYVGYSYYGARKQFGDNIGHEAHLFGALYGWLFLMALEPAMLPYFIDVLMNPTW